ncbi:MAG: endolytic transglycosylase MltG, partial [Saprospiraceae bacterium]|nr:endolytic transglycosylase MltG [Saprospiraceae bacterium]
SGNQTPVNLVINNVRTINDLAGKIASQVEVDSSTLANYLKDPSFLNKFDLDAEDAMTLFIPNTYQVYWTVSPDALSERLSQEKIKFWESNDRVRKATDLNLTPAQVYTLASIVERETQAGKERPTVAGLYLNRLKQGIPLQADPTVVFATGIYDLRRVLNVHLEIDSPYNTYKYAGLPPGPIFMPSIQSIDAVLDAEKHDYLYMCARPDNSGLHAFAASLSAHNQNANRYRQWLNDRGIK